MTKRLKCDRSIIENNNEFGKSALHIACELGTIKMIELLLKRNANANVIDKKTNKTGLLYAAKYGNLDIFDLFKGFKFNFRKFINKFDINHYISVFLVLCYYSHLHCLKYLFDNSSKAILGTNSITSINTTNSTSTLLQIATNRSKYPSKNSFTRTLSTHDTFDNNNKNATNSDNDNKTSSLTISAPDNDWYQINILASDCYGRNALHLAIIGTSDSATAANTVCYLLENVYFGSNIKDRRQRRQSMNILNGRDIAGSTPLHYAIAMKNDAIVELLVHYGCDVKCGIDSLLPDFNDMDFSIYVEYYRSQMINVMKLKLEEEKSDLKKEKQFANVTPLIAAIFQQHATSFERIMNILVNEDASKTELKTDEKEEEKSELKGTNHMWAQLLLLVGKFGNYEMLEIALDKLLGKEKTIFVENGKKSVSIDKYELFLSKLVTLLSNLVSSDSFCKNFIALCRFAGSKLLAEMSSSKTVILAKNDGIVVPKSFEFDKSNEFDKWYVAGLIGKGGFSSVYLGVDKETNRAVALKLMQKKRAEANMFKFNEIKALSCISHKNVIKLVGYNLNMEIDINPNMKWFAVESADVVSEVKAPFVITNPLVVILGIGKYDSGLPDLESVLQDYSNMIDVFAKQWRYKVFYYNDKNEAIYSNNELELSQNINFKLEWRDAEVLDEFVEASRKCLVGNKHDGLIFIVSVHCVYSRISKLYGHGKHLQ